MIMRTSQPYATDQLEAPRDSGLADEPAKSWFFTDRAISRVDDDRLNHASIAATLVNAIGSAEPPCMIGLLAEFGKGKSSTTNIAATMLKDSGEFDTVTVSADKHSGNARARNVVHAIAGELQHYNNIKPDEVEEILRPLRQSTLVSAADPTDTPANRFASGRYSYTGLAKSLLPFAIFAIVAAGLALITGAEAKNLLTIAAASPVLVWIVAMTFAGTDTPMGSMLTPGTLTDQKPRAEAADEIEEVFGRLIDHHHDKRSRKLVVFVDDIDRLSNDELLDALRALRSLQSVPRGREPIFVISCNESILRSAVGASENAPAAIEPEVVTPTDEEAPIAGGDDAPAPSPAPVVPTPAAELDAESDHDHPALAFIDKLLTARVQMPPTMRGDMRRFALDLVGGNHPLRTENNIDVERVVAILVHDGVDDPRSVVRLLNHFVSAYLLGREREESEVVFVGDITHHVDVLAQLCVLLDEFPHFHDEITRNSLLLVAAHKVALRHDDLSSSERSALEQSTAFRPDPGEPSGFRFVRPALRRYLSGTARRVAYPDDIGPLVYFASTPGGRRLGAQLRSELVTGLASGDPEDLAAVLSRVPDDRVVDAAGEITDLLHDASPVDAGTYVAAVAPILDNFGDAAPAVGDACADLLDRAPDDRVPAPLLTKIIDHTGPERVVLLCDRLVRHDEDTVETNDRLVHTGAYLAGHPSVRSRVEPAVQGWVNALPSEGGWDLARLWLDVAEALNADDYEDLLLDTVTALTQSIRSEQGFSEEDGDRLVQLAETTVIGHAAAAPSSSALSQTGPATESALVRLWRITEHSGNSGDAQFAATASADTTLDAEVRRVAVGLTTSWAEAWKDATRPADTEGDEPLPVAPEITACLLEAANDPEVLPAIATRLPDLARAMGAAVDELLAGVAAVAVDLRDAGNIDVAEPVACKIIEAASTAGDAAIFAKHVALLLQPINTDSDPASPVVEMTLRLVAAVAARDQGAEALSPVADQWDARIRKAGGHDDRSRIEGFRALDDAVSTLVAPHAEPILTQMDQLIAGADEPAERLRVLATFPWPAEHVARALALLDTHWDTVPADARLRALQLLTHATDGEETLPRFHDRIVAAVQADPYAAISLSAAREFSRMDEPRRIAVLTAAVGKHEAITAVWIALDDEAAAATVADGARDAETAERLLGTLPDSRQPAAAAAALARVASTAQVPEAIVQALAGRCDSSGRSSAADAALDTLDQPGPATLTALRVLHAARTAGVTVDTARVGAAARTHLPDADAAVAELFGRTLKGVRLSRELGDLLKELRKDPDTESVAGAFDAGRNA